MQITKEEVLKIAKIARIAVDEDEIEGYRKQLEDVLSYAACVKKIAAEIDATVSYKNINVFRQDSVERFNPEEILQRAPDRQENYFVVPRILENK